MTDAAAPLAGLRVLDYSQFVAGPLCTMLLADLGADVVKVEPPAGDAYRHYEPLGGAESTRFYALNQGKRSIVCDLKTDEGRELSRQLLATGDVVVHNMPPERARAFDLDTPSVHTVNDTVVVVAVSAFGTEGPHRDRIGYDLVSQAYSGLLMADARPGDEAPRRSGGIPYSDITSGLVACISALAGLTSRSQRKGREFEVSLLSAALLTQVQDFVRLDSGSVPTTTGTQVTRSDLARIADEGEEKAKLESYYGCYEASDGYFALACLTTAQRKRVLQLLDLEDPWVDNPQAQVATEEDRAKRVCLAQRFGERFATRPVSYWVSRFREANVPAGEVRLLQHLFDDEQVVANGLVRRISQNRGGEVDLLGSPFKIDGDAMQPKLPAPRLGEHTDQLMTELATNRGRTRVI